MSSDEGEYSVGEYIAPCTITQTITTTIIHKKSPKSELNHCNESEKGGRRDSCVGESGRDLKEPIGEYTHKTTLSEWRQMDREYMREGKKKKR